MKKAIMAAAVASAFVATGALAAEGPTISVYWPMAINIGDTDEDNGNISTTNETIVDGGGQNFAFTWSDNLNNGMTLHAFMQFGTLANSNGDPRFGANGVDLRDSHLGFSGDFGFAAFGTNEHFFETDLIYDGYGADWATGGEALNHILIGRTGFNFTRRDGESVWWNSNVMNGVQLKAAYTFGGAADRNDVADSKGHQLGVSYSSGALTLGANIAEYTDYAVNGGVAANAEGTEASGTSFRAGYDFGNFSVTGAMWDLEQTGMGGAQDAVSVNGYAINFTMPVASGRVILNIAELGDQDVLNATTGVSAALNDSGKSSFDIGYQHDMSANTYVFIRYDSSETGVNFNDDLNAAGADIPDVNSESDNLMLGVVFAY